MARSVVTNKGATMKPTPKTAIAMIVLHCAINASANAQSDPSTSLSSEAWLQKNLEDKSVVQTDSGLQYKVLQSSQGCYPDARKPVTIHYEVARAEDNRVIDSSFQRGKPNTFSLDKMIKAWKEGIPLMREG